MSQQTTTPIFSNRQPLGPLHTTVIKVLGLGGGGCNAINRMIEQNVSGIEFIAANTDIQALQQSKAQKRILLGSRATRGLGAGGNPEIGEQAARESAAEIAEALSGADMVFLTCSLGGGTGTGAIGVAAEIAQKSGAVTIAIVTTPFTFEGSRRSKNANFGIAKLRRHCNTLVTVPNDRLLSCLPRNIQFSVALRCADEVLRHGVLGIVELITRPGLINVDFANVRALMQHAGGALLTIGKGTGPNKTLLAVKNALQHKLLDVSEIGNASGLLVYFKGGDDLAILDISAAMEQLRQITQPNAEIVWGACIDSRWQGNCQVILLATGVGSSPIQEWLPQQAKPESTPTNKPVPEAAVEQSSVGNIVARETVVAARPEPATLAPKPNTPARDWSTLNSEASTLDVPAFLRRRQAQAAVVD